MTGALIERAKHVATKACVVIDGSHHAERNGYGKTGTWRALMKATELRVMPGTRLGSAWCRASTQPAASRGWARYRRWASAPPLTPEPGRAARRRLPARRRNRMSEAGPDWGRPSTAGFPNAESS